VRVNGNPGLSVTAVIPGGLRILGKNPNQADKKSLARRRGFSEADKTENKRVKLAFQLSTNKTGQANQSGSQQSQSTGLGNGGGNDRVAAGEGH